jgi:signal peptide peptidase SppA
MDSRFGRFLAVPAWALHAQHLLAWARLVHGIDLTVRDRRTVAQDRFDDAQEGLEARSSKRVAAGAPAIAVLPLVGVVSQRGDMCTASTSEFAQLVTEAVADPAIKALVLEIDSPGGEVAGTDEAASVVRAARASKPVVAIANSLAASAAYWIASQATEVMVTPSGEVGSIGVYGVHEDLSGALDQAGVKVSFISAGEGKTDGNPYEPLSDQARTDQQARVNDVYGMFCSAVAKGRGVGVEVVRTQWKAKVYGARQAVEMGLANSVGTLDDAIRRAASLSRRQAPAAAEAEAIRIRRDRA